MFRRSKPEPTPEVAQKAGGKGRPTPTRKEAEAAARARAKSPRTRKEQAKAQREARTTRQAQVRQAMKTGDERYYMARDKGPVRRYIRDSIDNRFSFVELLMPLLILNILIGLTGNLELISIGNTVLFAAVAVVVIELVILRFRVRREVARRFPDAPMRGVTWYAISRALQIRWLRLPKPQVRIGQKLPEVYR